MGSELQDTVLDGMSSEADYWHYQTWRKNEDVTIVLSGLIEQTEYSHVYCFAEDDEPDGLNPSSHSQMSQMLSFVRTPWQKTMYEKTTRIYETMLVASYTTAMCQLRKK